MAVTSIGEDPLFAHEAHGCGVLAAPNAPSRQQDSRGEAAATADAPVATPEPMARLLDLNPRAAASALAGLGLAVFPLHSVDDVGGCTCGADCGRNAGKHPRTRRGFHDASVGLEQIEAWWRQWPDANIGVATGATSGVWVLDVDPDKGGHQSLVELELDFGKLGPTWCVETGGGGRHYWVRSLGVPLRSNAGLLAPGLDVRADGGYVVVPPSTHRCGRVYRWNEQLCPAKTPLLQAPRWLPKLLHDNSHKTMVPPACATGDSGKRGNDCRELPEMIPEGQRNTVLMRFAGAMRRYGFGDDAIRAALLAENAARCVPALPEEEVARIARSVDRYVPTKDLAKMLTRSQSRGFIEFVAGKAVQR